MSDISYPISAPTSPQPNSMILELDTPQSLTTGMYSGIVTSYLYNAAKWKVTVTLPPMERSDAGKWLGFLGQLQGAYGTFTMGLYGHRSKLMGSTRVNGALAVDDESGNYISTDGWAANSIGLLKAGDFVTIDGYLHMICADVNSDASGAAYITIAPGLRSVSVDGTAVVVRDLAPTWRLSDTLFSTSISDAQHYGLAFTAEENITAS